MYLHFYSAKLNPDFCMRHQVWSAPPLSLPVCLSDPAASLESPPPSSPPPPPDLPVCRTAPLCYSVCVRERDCQRGWGQPIQPLQSPSNRAVWCGTGDGGWLYSGWGRAKSSRIRRIERRRKRSSRRVRVWPCCWWLGMLTCLLCSLKWHAAADETKYLVCTVQQLFSSEMLRLGRLVDMFCTYKQTHKNTHSTHDVFRGECLTPCWLVFRIYKAY